MTDAPTLPQATPVEAGGWLHATALVDSGHPDILAVARGVTARCAGARDRAVAIHDFVRDHVPYGYAPALLEMSASDVLAGRVGHSIDKGTLFVALLRASGVPARLRFLEIHAGLVRGILAPGAPWIVHAVAEVLLDRRWIRLDSYVVDPPLLSGARRRLHEEGALMGYGAHRRGSSRWCGTREARSQAIEDPAWRITGRDFGVFEDACDFRERAARLLGPRSITAALALSLTWMGANGRIQRIRDGA